MAILNFMPQFVPWSTKALLKKKDDPDVAAATESTTGFFGDTFDFIDDAFDWTATAVEEPAIQYEAPPQYFDAPVAPPEPFYDVPPQYYDEPVQDMGFGSAIGDIFNGSGEGLGFDFIGEPTDNWTSQAPFEVPQADYNWDGGMGFEPVPPPAAPAYGFGEGIGDQFSNYFNWNSEVAPTPTPYTPASDWGSMDIQPTEPPLLPQGEQQPWMNLDFPDFGSTLTDWADPAPRYEDAVPMENPSAISSGIMDFPEPDPMGWDDISSMFDAARPEPTPAPQTWDIPGMENPSTAIPGWFSMTPDERGEYVWQSGLPAESYLTDEDIAGMSDEVRFKLNFAENDRANFMGDVNWSAPIGKKLWDAGQTVVAQPGELLGDLSLDPVKSMLDTENYNLDVNVPTSFNDLLPERGEEPQPLVSGSLDFQYPLQDTISNIRSADNPWDFAQSQGENFYDRPLAEQVALAYLAPGGGSGLYGSLKGVGLFDKAMDFAQGGFVSDIPGATSAIKNVILPGAVGAGTGLATEAIFDPTYTDQWGNEYDPGYAEMGLAGFGLGVGTKAATSAGTTPYGAGIKDVMKNFPVVSGTSKWGLPNQVKGDPGVNIEWEDPLDKALYQATSKSSAKTKPAVIALLKQHGISQSEINAAGEQIRARIAGIIDELSPKQGDTILVEPVARAVVDEIPTVPTPIRQAATVEVPTVPSAADEWTNLPAVSEAPSYIPRGSVLDDSDRITQLADEIPTVPTGIADEVVTPAPSTPLVERAVNHVEAILTEQELKGEAKRAAFAKWKSNLKDELNDKYPNDPRRALDEWYAQTKDVRMETYASKIAGLTEDEGKELFNAAIDKARNMGYGSAFTDPAIDKAIKSLVNGTNADPRQLRILRNVLTDTPYQKAADDAIETIAPKADGIVRRPNARIVDDTVEPGMDGPLTQTLDEVGTARIAPEDEAIIGADDVLFPEFKPSGIERTDYPSSQGSAYEPKMDLFPQEPFTSAGVTPDVPHVDAQVQLDGTLAPAQRDLGIATPPAAPDNFVPTVLRPVTDEWEQKALAAVKDKPMKDRAEILDKLQAELSGDLRKLTTEGSAANESIRARDRVVYALDQQNKAKVSESIDDWRATNYEDLDAIKATAKSSWGEKWIGGALKNKLADTLTVNGRQLDMHLQSQGYTFEEAKDMVERELANYLNSRMVRGIDSGNKDAILEHALTALHMGDFRPTIDGVDVAKGTGDVAKWIEASRTGNSVLKNMFFGIADVGAILGNAVPAMMTQGIPLGLGYLNRVLKLVDLEDALKNREFSGLASASAQDVMNANDGTALYWLGRAAGDNNLGKALIASDRPFTKWNEVLTKAQFDMLMTKGLRQPAYEGNLVLLKLLGRDINDVKVQRAAARMANAATSTAPLARGNTRRAVEGASLGSARYLRAQGDLLLAATKLINPKASLDERIIAMSAIVSIAAVAAGARELAGERLDLTPMKDGKFNPNFGNITLPDGTTMSFFGQKQLAETIMKSAMGLDDVVKKGDVSAITDAWSRFMVNRVGPAPSMALKGIAKTGYDPTTNKYSFPWEGEGFGSGMSPVQHALNMLPIPVGIMGFVNSDGTPLSKGLNFLGAGSYPEGDYSAALKKYGVDSMEEFEKLDPDTFMTRKEKLYQENPELRAKFADTAGAKIQESKKLNSDDFMNGNRKIAEWRTRKTELANNAEGVYGELALEEKERPEKDGSAQWIWDYNQTFANAKVDPSNEFSETNRDALGRLQAEFWAAHTDPKVRKEILDYQILKAPTEADKLFARDMARLNGINPDTGEALTYPNGKPMPNFFTMDKYIWKEVPNDEAEEFRVGFDSWKNRQKGKVLELSVDKQIELYIETSKDAQTRANGKQWTPAAIKDVQNYGDKSKIRPLYTSYEEEMLPELLWFKPKQEWATIKEAHDNRE